MKRVVIFIYLSLTMIFFSCYDGNDNAYVRINIGNLHAIHPVQKKSIIDSILNFFSKEVYAQSVPGDVLGINIAVLDGGSRIYYGKFSASETVINIYIKPGKNYTIIAGAEGADYENAGNPNIILYYGKVITDVELNKENNINITLGNMNELFNLNFSFGTNIFSWNSISGTEKYELWYASFMTMCLPTDYTKTGESLTNSYDMGGYTQGCFRVRSYFPTFNLYSEYSNSISP